MPITQLMSKLQTKLDSRLQRNSTTSSLEARRSGCDPMDCSASFEVVAEVLPVSPGSRTGSMCSASSSAGSEEGAAPINVPEQNPTVESRPSVSSAALLASSLSGPLPSLGSVSGKPATDRALRARGKAMLRTEAGLPCINTSLSPSDLDMNRQLSLESSSSMMDATMSASLPYNYPGNLASPRYVRATTAPLPGSLKAAAQLAAPAGPSGQQVQTKTAPSKAPVQAPAAAVDSEDEDDELVHPISPADAAAVQDQGPEHCHWEDGVIASWLQGFDHSELLHTGDEEDEEAQPAPAEAACSKAAVASSSVPNPVFSSLLYN